MSQPAEANYMLPATLTGRADFARMVREIETIDNDFEAQKVRNHGEDAGYKMPAMSRILGDFLELNKVDVTKGQERMVMKERLRVMKDKAPLIHMTFAVDADPDFLQQLVSYIRKEIHPQALISVGLQPSLVGGVYMRTPNHVHDFSIKTLLAGKRDIMVHELEGLL